MPEYSLSIHFTFQNDQFVSKGSLTSVDGQRYTETILSREGKGDKSPSEVEIKIIIINNNQTKDDRAQIFNSFFYFQDHSDIHHSNREGKWFIFFSQGLSMFTFNKYSSKLAINQHSHK